MFFFPPIWIDLASVRFMAWREPTSVAGWLYLWGSPFWGEIFAYVTVFNPTIEVITFRLRGYER